MENWIGLATFITALGTVFLALRKGKREGRQDDEARLEKLEKNERLLLNYVHALRGQLSAAGVKVPDWPKELTEK